MGARRRAEAQGEFKKRRPGHESIAAAVASAARRPGHLARRAPPLLPGWKEPSYKSPLAKTEPKLRVGLQIPSLDEARRKPEAHHTVASKKFSVSLPAPSPEEDRVHKEFRTTPRFSPDEKPKKRRSRRRSPSAASFPWSRWSGWIVDIEPDYKPGPRTAAPDVECMRGALTCSYRLLQRKTRAAEEVVHATPAPSPRRYLGPSWGRKRGDSEAARARAGLRLWSRARSTRGWSGHCNTATTRARRASSGAQPADGAERHPHGGGCKLDRFFFVSWTRDLHAPAPPHRVAIPLSEKADRAQAPFLVASASFPSVRSATA